MHGASQFMGVVESVGSEVTRFKPGDRVVACFDLGCGARAPPPRPLNPSHFARSDCEAGVYTYICACPYVGQVSALPQVIAETKELEIATTAQVLVLSAARIVLSLH